MLYYATGSVIVSITLIRANIISLFIAIENYQYLFISSYQVPTLHIIQATFINDFNSYLIQYHE